MFDPDLKHYPNCGGGIKIIAAILEQPVIAKILAHLGSPAAGARSTHESRDRFWASDLAVRVSLKSRIRPASVLRTLPDSAHSQTLYEAHASSNPREARFLRLFGDD